MCGNLRIQVRNSCHFSVIYSALLTPLLYILYVIIVRTLQGVSNIVNINNLLSLSGVLYYLILSIIGGIIVLNWYYGLRVASSATVGGLFVWPWVYFFTGVGNIGYILILFVGVLLITCIEALMRFPVSFSEFHNIKNFRHAIVVGGIHLLLGGGLQIYSRQEATGILILLAYAVSALGLIATGGIPVVLWSWYRTVSPGLVTVAWFLWGFYGTWKIHESLPRGEFAGVDWGGLPPYPDYMLKWTVLSVIILIVTGIELGARRSVRKENNIN